MAQPITWKTLAAPDTDSSSRMLERAGNRFGKALDSAAGIGEVAVAREQRQKTLSNEHFTNQLLSRFQTPEALEQARADGSIDQLASQYEHATLSATGAKAINTQIGEARTRAEDGFQFQDAQLKNSSVAFEQEAAGLFASGDMNAFNQYMAENASNFYDPEGFITTMQDQNIQNQNHKLNQATGWFNHKLNVDNERTSDIMGEVGARINEAQRLGDYEAVKKIQASIPWDKIDKKQHAALKKQMQSTLDQTITANVTERYISSNNERIEAQQALIQKRDDMFRIHGIDHTKLANSAYYDSLSTEAKSTVIDYVNYKDQLGEVAKPLNEDANIKEAEQALIEAGMAPADARKAAQKVIDDGWAAAGHITARRTAQLKTEASNIEKRIARNSFYIPEEENNVAGRTKIATEILGGPAAFEKYNEGLGNGSLEFAEMLRRGTIEIKDNENNTQTVPLDRQLIEVMAALSHPGKTFFRELPKEILLDYIKQGGVDPAEYEELLKLQARKLEIDTEFAGFNDDPTNGYLNKNITRLILNNNATNAQTNANDALHDENAAIRDAATRALEVNREHTQDEIAARLRGY